MSYTKQGFYNGWKLEANHLEKIEDGIIALQDLHTVKETYIECLPPSDTSKLKTGSLDYLYLDPSVSNLFVGKPINRIKITGNANLGSIIIGIASGVVAGGNVSDISHTTIATITTTVANETKEIELENPVILKDGDTLYTYSATKSVGFAIDLSPAYQVFYEYPLKGGVLTKGDNNCAIITVGYEGLAISTPDDSTYNPLNKFKGKTVSIVGDSISTFRGYIPSGYATFYPSSTLAQKGTGSLTAVEQTWWHKLCKESGLTLLKNASWSGSWVTGDSTSTINAIYACSTKRVNDLAGSNGESPDIIICYIGINDLYNSDVASRGIVLGTWTPDKEIVGEGDIKDFGAAYALMLKKIITAYPEAKVFCCTLLTTGRTYKDTQGVETFPTSHRDVTLNQVNNKIREVANGIGCNVIEVHNCGINYFNIGRYTIDMTHPNADGATLIKNQMLAELIAKY